MHRGLCWSALRFAEVAERFRGLVADQIGVERGAMSDCNRSSISDVCVHRREDLLLVVLVEVDSDELPALIKRALLHAPTWRLSELGSTVAFPLVPRAAMRAHLRQHDHLFTILDRVGHLRPAMRRYMTLHKRPARPSVEAHRVVRHTHVLHVTVCVLRVHSLVLLQSRVEADAATTTT